MKNLYLLYEMEMRPTERQVALRDLFSPIPTTPAHPLLLDLQHVYILDKTINNYFVKRINNYFKGVTTWLGLKLEGTLVEPSESQAPAQLIDMLCLCENKLLSMLSLSRNPMKQKQLLNLAGALGRQAFPNLQHIDLSRCQIDKDGMHLIAPSFCKLHYLIKLDLSHNLLDDEGIEVFRASFQYPTLQWLNLMYNPCTDNATKQLAKHIRANVNHMRVLRTVHMNSSYNDDENPILLALQLNRYETKWQEFCRSHEIVS